MSEFSHLAPDPRTVLLIAKESGIELGPERLESLTQEGEELHRITLAQEAGYQTIKSYFFDNGLQVSLCFSTKPDTSCAVVDFFPSVDGDTVIAPRKSQASKIINQGLVSLQNYILLAESGYIRKPLVIEACTNPTMAMLAKRVGFVTVTEFDPLNDIMSPALISTTYSNLRDATISSRTDRTIKLLRKRLERQK